MEKRRIIKKFELLSSELLALVNEEYPDGFEDNLITFQLPTGELATGVPLETEDARYLIRLPKTAVTTDDDDDEGDEKSERDNFESLESLEMEDEPGDDDEDD